MWLQKSISLKAKPRGFHIITDDIVRALPELASINVGLLHVFIKHSSASLTINENADPTVRQDFESYFNQSVKENEPYYRHTYEGSDDMPAHLKAQLAGALVSPYPLRMASCCWAPGRASISVSIAIMRVGESWC